MLKEAQTDTPEDTIRKLRCHVLSLQTQLEREQAHSARLRLMIRTHNKKQREENSVFERIFGPSIFR